jgi:hypothetical protein
MIELAKLRSDNIVMARERAHAVFDLLHTLGFVDQDAAYAWLAGAMGLPLREAHIGRMNPEQCNRVVVLVSLRLRRLVDELRQARGGCK